MDSLARTPCIPPSPPLLLLLLQISEAPSRPLELRLLFTGRRLISVWSSSLYLSLRLLEGVFSGFVALLYYLFFLFARRSLLGFGTLAL